MSGESREPEDEAREQEQGVVVVGSLLEACGNATPLLEPVDAALNDVAPSIALSIQNEGAARATSAALTLVGSFWDGVGYAALTQDRAAGGVAVALVSDEVVRTLARTATPPGTGNPNGVQETDQLGAVMPLPRGEQDGEGTPLPITSEVDLGCQPAPAPPERLVRAMRPLFRSAVAGRLRAPAAC